MATMTKGQHGGARPGAGRKSKPRPRPARVAEDIDPLEFLRRVMLGRIHPTPLQVRAAIAMAQYTHTRRHDGGQKEEAQRKAELAATKFATALPPRLGVVAHPFAAASDRK